MRLIEIRLRLPDGLPAQIDAPAPNAANRYIMAYATYVAGLLLVHELRTKDVRTIKLPKHGIFTETELRGLSLEAPIGLYF